jgi:hypothetical protein
VFVELHLYDLIEAAIDGREALMHLFAEGGSCSAMYARRAMRSWIDSGDHRSVIHPEEWDALYYIDYIAGLARLHRRGSCRR